MPRVVRVDVLEDAGDPSEMIVAAGDGAEGAALSTAEHAVDDFAHHVAPEHPAVAWRAEAGEEPDGRLAEFLVQRGGVDPSPYRLAWRQVPVHLQQYLAHHRGLYRDRDHEQRLLG